MRLMLVGLIAGLMVFQGCAQKKPEPKVVQKYVLVVEITAPDCSDCQEIHRIVQNLKEKYRQEVGFLTLNMTNTSAKLHGQEMARRLNCETFVKRYQDRPGTVGFLNAANGERFGMLQNELDETKYVEALESALKEIEK